MSNSFVSPLPYAVVVSSCGVVKLLSASLFRDEDEGFWVDSVGSWLSAPRSRTLYGNVTGNNKYANLGPNQPLANAPPIRASVKKCGIRSRMWISVACNAICMRAHCAVKMSNNKRTRAHNKAGREECAVLQRQRIDANRSIEPEPGAAFFTRPWRVIHASNENGARRYGFVY